MSFIFIIGANYTPMFNPPTSFLPPTPLVLLSGNQFLKPPQIHLLLQQRNNIGIKGLPVRVIQVIFLRGLVEVALDDGEILLVMDGLHHEPGQSLPVLGVDGGCFEEFGVEFGDAFGVRFGAEVYGNRHLKLGEGLGNLL